MKVSIGASVAFLTCWLGWSIVHFRRPSARLSLAFCLLMPVAGAFEVFDFAPLWDCLDAHAMWHFATVPLTAIWYRFLAADGRRAAGEGSKKAG